MSERCERCRRGFSNSAPKDDVEWLTDPPGAWRPGADELYVARCKRCGSMLLDRWHTDAETEGKEHHDVAVVLHDAARAAVTERRPAAIAAVSPQLRRRHLELLVDRMQLEDRESLERIERGQTEATEAFRGLVAHRLATMTPAPPIGDVLPRPAPSFFSTSGTRLRIDLDAGTRLTLELTRDVWWLTRVRGDAVEWRAELHSAGREALLGAVSMPDGDRAVALIAAPTAGEQGELFVVDVATGAVLGRSMHRLRAAPLELRALPSGCIFVATFQRFAVVRGDASVVCEGGAAAMPVAAPVADGVVLIDAPWRLLSLSLPSGEQRWSVPIDRSAAIAPSRDGHVLLSTGDAVARLDVRGPTPRVAWIASGHTPLALDDGGAALVRDRTDKSTRRIECAVYTARGERRQTISRPDANKAPTAQLSTDVLLFHSGGEVAVAAGEHIVYALSLPDRRTAHVTLDVGGAWVSYDGVVDRIASDGQRVGRWRLG